MLLLLSIACQPTTPTPPEPTESTESTPTETDPPTTPPPVPRPTNHRNGDIDGDGYDDLVVTEPYVNGYGSMYVYRGGPGRTLDKSPDFVQSGFEKDALFGIPVDLPGDLDGDGLGEVLVGAPFGEEAYVSVWKGTRGLDLVPVYLIDAGADGLFGTLARGVGDATGDGIDDLLVGSPTGYYAKPGRVYLVHGATAFDGEVRTELWPTTPSPAFGQAGAGVGDVDGDGVNDLLLARPALSDPLYDYADLFLGGDGVSDQELSGPEGFAIQTAGVGDYDGDGRPDVVIGAPNTFTDDLSRIWLYTGTSTGLDPTPTLSYTEAGDTYLGASIAAASDVDGDETPDFVCGAPFAGTDRGGSAYVMLGGTNDLEPDILLEGTGPGVGWRVGAIDANGDGLGDVLVNRQDYASPDLDRVRIYYGSAAFDGIADTVLVGGGPEGEFGHELPHGLLR